MKKLEKEIPSILKRTVSGNNGTVFNHGCPDINRDRFRWKEHSTNA